MAAGALVACALAGCTRDEPADPFANADPSQRAAIESLQAAIASEEAEIRNPPPLPSLTPDRTTLTADEAHALVLHLVPRTGEAPFEGWGGYADAPLDDAQVRVCGDPYPLPFDGGPSDMLKDGSSDLVDWHSRGLTDGPDRAVSVTTFVFADTARAQRAVARLRSAGSRMCATEDVTLADKPNPAQDSADLIIEAFDGSYAASVLSLRAGPVLVVVEAHAPGFERAVRDSVDARKWAEATLRRSGLLR